MGTVVYVVDPDPEERRWIETVLSPNVDAVRSLDDAEALLALLGVRDGACLIVSLEPNEAAALELIRELRMSGSMIPVIALGPETAFQTATGIARLAFTGFVERPLAGFRLLAAVRNAVLPIP